MHETNTTEIDHVERVNYQLGNVQESGSVPRYLSRDRSVSNLCIANVAKRGLHNEDISILQIALNSNATEKLN